MKKEENKMLAERFVIFITKLIRNKKDESEERDEIKEFHRTGFLETKKEER